MVEPWAPMEDLQAELEALKQKQDALKDELKERRKNLVELQRKKRRVLETQIRRAKARLSTAERKRRTHRLVLLGSYLDHCMQTDTESEPRVMKGLDEFLTRNQDRAVFNLPPRLDPKPDA